jgi:putative addiction module component (TIGR02574 family)
MTPTLEDLGIAGLPIEQRLEIAELIHESVARELEMQPLTHAQKAELERRLQLYQQDPNRGSPIEEVFARLDRKFGW